MNCCQNCKYFSPDRNDDNECRRYPPTLVQLSKKPAGIMATTAFPSVDPHQWCGEWQPLPVDAADVRKQQEI